MLCDLYGLDTISTGVAIAFATELYEKGIIGKNETDGLELRWGDPELIIELVRRIAFRVGNLGNLLAEGVKKAAEVPVIGVGGIKTAQEADAIIQSRKVDLVAVGRAILKDPKWAFNAIKDLKGTF
jgi:aldehyde:ferredoxin oxidoreductase